MPIFDFLKKKRKRRRPKKIEKFIFTKRQWIILLVAIILVAVLTAVATTLFYMIQDNNAAEERARQDALFSVQSKDFAFDSHRLEIPDEMKAERKKDPVDFRTPREKWSEAQIKGTHGEGEWTDPSEISTDIFEEKNDALIKDLFSEVP